MSATDLYAIFHNPLWFREFFFKNLNEEPWETYYYQIPWALEKDIVAQCGRGVGKSVDLEMEVLRRAFIQPKRESLIVTQSETHLNPRCDRIIDLLEGHPFFKMFKKKATRRPFYNIEVANHKIYGRSAGTKGGANFLGFHVDNIYVDEAQELELVCEAKLQQSTRDSSCSWRFYGVHNGRRDTALFQHGYKDPYFVNRSFRVPSYFRPSWDKAEEERLARLYGGIGSPNWINNVEGLPGEVAYGVWPYDDLIANFDERPMQDIVITHKDLLEIMPKEEAREKNTAWFSLENLSLPFDAPFLYEACVAGMDATYSGDPAIILIAFKHNNKWEIPFRISLNNIIPNDQAWIVKYLIDTFKIQNFAIDATGADGKNIKDNLEELGYHLYPVIFSENIEVNGKLEYTKEFSTLLALSNLKDRIFVIYDSPSLLDEFLGEKAKRGQAGKTIYQAKKDHSLSAFRCLNMAIWSLNKLKEEEGEEFFVDIIGKWTGKIL